MKGVIYSVIAVVVVALILFGLIISGVVSFDYMGRINSTLDQSQVNGGSGGGGGGGGGGSVGGWTPPSVTDCTSDSDGGNNFFASGCVSLDDGTDECDLCDRFTSKTIYEMACVSGTLEMTEYECPKGCDSGKCIGGLFSKTTCEDYDTGLNFFKKSKVEFYQYSHSPTILNDECTTGTSVKEFYCREDDPDWFADTVVYDCPHGCADGKCNLP